MGEKWLVGDVIRGLLALLGAILSCVRWLIVRKHLKGRNSISRLLMMTFFNGLLLAGFNVGAHEPVFMGWRAFLVMSTATNFTLATIGMYIVILVIAARSRQLSYSGKKNADRLVKATKLWWLVVAFLMLTGMVGTLITDSYSFAMLRHLAMAAVVLSCFSITYEVWKIRLQVAKHIRSLGTQEKWLENKLKLVLLEQSGRKGNIQEFDIRHELGNVKGMKLMNSKIKTRLTILLSVGIVAIILAEAILLYATFSALQNSNGRTYSEGVIHDSQSWSIQIEIMFDFQIAFNFYFIYYPSIHKSENKDASIATMVIQAGVLRSSNNDVKQTSKIKGYLKRSQPSMKSRLGFCFFRKSIVWMVDVNMWVCGCVSLSWCV
mmetsp:Transcript_16679/g.29921  ORF Transcript_16679/g.29921 Transcript_16679/m.29921 type:complete len:377 (+) Transcript_16679:243-1373(+)